MFGTLMLSMSLLTAIPQQTPIQNPVVARSLDRASMTAQKSAAQDTSLVPTASPATEEEEPVITVSPAAQKHLGAVEKYVANGMREPVPVVTRVVHNGKMHNFLFQKTDIRFGVYIAYDPKTKRIDALGNGSDVIGHDTTFKIYGLVWLVSVAALIFLPLLNVNFRSGGNLVYLWMLSMIGTTIATLVAFWTSELADSGEAKGYVLACIFGCLAIKAGAAAYSAAKQDKQAWTHPTAYGLCMLASLLSFMFL